MGWREEGPLSHLVAMTQKRRGFLPPKRPLNFVRVLCLLSFSLLFYCPLLHCSFFHSFSTWDSRFFFSFFAKKTTKGRTIFDYKISFPLPFFVSRSRWILRVVLSFFILHFLRSFLHFLVTQSQGEGRKTPPARIRTLGCESHALFCSLGLSLAHSGKHPEIIISHSDCLLHSFHF